MDHLSEIAVCLHEAVDERAGTSGICLFGHMSR